METNELKEILEEKNKAKKKMLQGLRDEFQFIYNKLDLNELPF